MPKIVALIALVLMLLTGLIIGNLSALTHSGQTPDVLEPSSTATSRAAVAFYDAIDWFLESGDVSPLRRVAHPNYADHSPLSNEPGTFDGFETWLLSMRTAAPDMRFVVSEIVSRNDLIAVELEQTGTAKTALAGLPLTFPAASSSYEFLRIEDKLVIERWASPALPGLIEPSVANLEGLINAGWIREPRLERLTFDEHASLSVARHKGMVLIVESGSFNLRNREPATNASERLDPGAIRAIPPDMKVNVWNAGPAGATLIAVTLVQHGNHDRYYSTTHTAEGLEIGIARRLIGGGATIRPRHGPFRLQVGHAVAAPGTLVARHEVNELEILFVTKGTVEATLEDGWVFILTDSSGLKPGNDVAIVGPDQALSAGYGTELSYEVTGNEPAEFWLITVMPES